MQAFTTSCIPDTQGPVRTAGDKEALIVAGGNACDRLCVAMDTGNLITHSNVVNADRAICTTGDSLSARTSKDNCFNGVAMTLQEGKLGSTLPCRVMQLARAAY